MTTNPLNGMSKALLAQKLKARGFVLKPTHWKEIDRLLKRGNGYVTKEAVMVAAHKWGWNEPMLAELLKALSKDVG